MVIEFHSTGIKILYEFPQHGKTSKVEAEV